MRVLVLGATGGTGKAIVEGCLAAGHDVRALVRRPDAVGITSDHLEVVKGDALDTIAVGDAVRGMDAVISSLGSRPWRSDDVCSKGTAVLLGAMTLGHVSRLIVISSVGVTATLAHADFMTRAARATILRGVLADKDRMESLVMASRLEWVIVRPVVLTNGAATGKFRVADDASIPGGSVTRADVATLCVGELDKREWTRKSPSIVGQ
jgi:uncharacterized protein YbjT (DUF2867 family)